MTAVDERVAYGASPRPLLDGLTGNSAPLGQGTAARGRRIGRWLRLHGTIVRHTVVGTIGFGCPTVAAYLWHTWAGLVATGVAVLLLDKAMDVGQPS